MNLILKLSTDVDEAKAKATENNSLPKTAMIETCTDIEKHVKNINVRTKQRRLNSDVGELKNWTSNVTFWFHLNRMITADFYESTTKNQIKNCTERRIDALKGNLRR